MTTQQIQTTEAKTNAALPSLGNATEGTNALAGLTAKELQEAKDFLLFSGSRDAMAATRTSHLMPTVLKLMDALTKEQRRRA